MIEELATRVFQARDAAHRAHWRTKSYAEHKALDEFYHDVVDAVDAIIECYQGQFGLIGAFGVSVSAMNQDNMAKYLAAEADWIEENCEEIAQDSESVENLIASLLEEYRTTVYKLVNLK